MSMSMSSSFNDSIIITQNVMFVKFDVVASVRGVMRRHGTQWGRRHVVTAGDEVSDYV